MHNIPRRQSLHNTFSCRNSFPVIDPRLYVIIKGTIIINIEKILTSQYLNEVLGLHTVIIYKYMYIDTKLRLKKGKTTYVKQNIN